MTSTQKKELYKKLKLSDKKKFDKAKDARKQINQLINIFGL